MTTRNYNVIETDCMSAEELQILLNEKAYSSKIDCVIGTKIVMSSPSNKTEAERAADRLLNFSTKL